MKPSLICCLQGLSEDTRYHIANHYHCTTHPSILGEHILKAIHQGLMEQIHPWEQYVMEFLVFQWGDRPFSEEDPVLRSLSLSPSRFRTALILLRRKGLVYKLRNQPGGWVHWCPREIRRTFLTARDSEPISTEDLVLNEQDGAFSKGLWEGLFQFAVQLEREGLPLTRQGEVMRSAVRKLEVELDMSDEGLHFSRWKGAAGSPVIQLVADCAERLGILKKETHRWMADREFLSRWLFLPWSSRIQELFGLTEDLLLEDHPEWDGLWWEMMRYSGGWISFRETCLHWLEMKGTPFHTSFLEKTDKHWLCTLEALGWVQRKEQKGEVFWRWTPWAPPVGTEIPDMKGYVKPDFEILIPTFFPLHQRFLLAQFADCMGGEPLITYELSYSSVQRGLKRGFTEKDMLEVLEGISGGPPPDNITESLRGWTNDRRRPILEEVWLLWLPESDMWGLDAEKRRKWGIKSVSDGVFIVPQQQVEEVKSVLEAEGCTPVRKGDEEPWWRCMQGEPQLDEQPLTEEAVLVDPRYPSPKEAIPGWKQLPKIWTSGLRSYHSSTLGVILKKAASMELDVLYSFGNNEPSRFTPTEVFRSGEQWLVTGKDADGQKRQLYLKDMVKVQLLSPWNDLT